jgi:hypothetical protein
VTSTNAGHSRICPGRNAVATRESLGRAVSRRSQPRDAQTATEQRPGSLPDPAVAAPWSGAGRACSAPGRRTAGCGAVDAVVGLDDQPPSASYAWCHRRRAIEKHLGDVSGISPSLRGDRDERSGSSGPEETAKSGIIGESSLRPLRGDSHDSRPKPALGINQQCPAAVQRLLAGQIHDQ